MRPLRLVMKAFGPYAKQQVIDFAELRGHRLFLIHGPTGGGKTTILDAICYALYGETSGERKGEQMRSHLAAPDALTEVELEFALGEKRYRVRRSPRQTRPKKRGEGVVEINPEAELAEENGLPGSYAAIASGADKVRTAVEQLLGFRSDQFRQVIMLPQGKFRELLLADSKDREQILEMLFQTGYYEELQTRLAEEARAISDLLRQVESRRKLILAQTKAEQAESLVAMLQAADVALAQQEEQLARLRADETKAHAALSEAEGIVRLLDELDAAEKEQVKLKPWEPKIADWRKTLAAAERARKIVADERAVHDRRGELDQRKKSADAAAIAFRDATAIHDRAAADLAKAETQRAAAQAGRQQLAKLDDLRPRILRLERAETALAASRKAELEHTDSLARERAAIAQATAAVEKLTQQLTELHQQAAGLEHLKQLETQSQAQLTARQQLESLLPLIGRYTDEQQKLARQRELAEQRCTKGKAAVTDLFLRWMSGRAASLAAHLQGGEPCPVCGSREHPAPARSAAASVPGDDELTQARQQVEQLERVEKQAAEAVAKHENELAQLRVRQQHLCETLGALAGEPVESLRTACEVAQARTQAATNAQKQLPQLQAQLDRAAELAKTGQQRIEGLEAQLQTTRNTVAAQRAARDECLCDLPEQLRTVAAVEAEYARVQKSVADVEASIRSVEDLAKKAATDLAAAEEKERAMHSEFTAAEARLTAARDTFAARLQEVGFASESEFTAARLTESQVLDLRDRIERGEKSLAAAADRLDRARQSAAKLARPDLNAVRQAHAAAKQQCDAAVARRSDLDAQRKTLAGLQQQLEETARQFAQLDEQHRIIGTIAEVASGKNPKGLKLHRFVLGFLLDDVLSAATQRLRTMSRGRYQLQRMQEIEDRRISGGLDLEVFDAHTGSARPVATLSGGESFQASLSLSLGLADVVQARAGGIRMETMFVDEGFGSLDADALDEAIRAIQDLQKSGRMVGIISHVPELRQLVGARLEITSGPAGSSAAFHVA